MKIIKKLGAIVLAVMLVICNTNAIIHAKSTPIADFYSGKTQEFLNEIENGNYPESLDYTRDYGNKKKYSITDKKKIKDISDALVQIVVEDMENDADSSKEDKLIFTDSKGNEFSFRFRDHKLYDSGDYYSMDEDDDLWDLLDKEASGNTIKKDDGKYITETADEMGLTYDMPKDWTSMIESDGSVTMAVKQNETTFWFPAIQIFEIFNYNTADDFFDVTFNYFQEKYPDEYGIVQESREESGMNYPVSSIGVKYNDGAGLLVRYSYVVQMGDRYFAVESMEDEKATKEVRDITLHVINSLKLVDDDSLTDA